jgi:quercetin dioxygenase-like cupin family protein
MANTNQVITNAIIGDRVKFLVTSEDSGGNLLKVELWCKPGAKGPPLHYHPLQKETFEVVRGTLGIDDNNEKMALSAGEKYSVPANSLHRFYNASNEEDVVVLVSLEPALKTEFFFETLYSLANQGKTDENSLPKSILQFAAMMHEYDGEMLASGPPIFLQKFMARGLGSLAKLLGYKGFIPFEKHLGT